MNWLRWFGCPTAGLAAGDGAGKNSRPSRASLTGIVITADASISPVIIWRKKFRGKHLNQLINQKVIGLTWYRATMAEGSFNRQWWFLNGDLTLRSWAFYTKHLKNWTYFSISWGTRNFKATPRTSWVWRNVRARNASRAVIEIRRNPVQLGKPDRRPALKGQSPVLCLFPDDIRLALIVWRLGIRQPHLCNE